MGRAADPGKDAAILKAATRLFLANGYESVSIEAIANCARVSKVTLYKRFQTKEQLFRVAMMRECARSVDAFAWEQSAPTLRDQLVDFGWAMDAFLSRPKFLQMERQLASKFAENPEIREAYLGAVPHHLLASLTQILTSEQHAGRLALPSLSLAAEQLFSMLSAFSALERRFGHKPCTAVIGARIEGAVDLFLHVYGCKPEAAAATL